MAKESIVAAPAGQNNWRFCNKCYSLWWNGRPDNGHCPAGGAHEGSGSWDFCLLGDPVGLGQGPE
jgi:hypothetical protein